MAYRYKRTLNNNAVVALDEHGEEVIILGKGIALKCGRGATHFIAPGLVERIFTVERYGDKDYYEQLIERIPLELVALVEDLVREAGCRLHFDFQNRLTLTLLDHVAFARERELNNERLGNPLLEDIRLFYPDEFAAAQNAVCRLNDELGTHFDDDEASFISFHFISAMSSEPQGILKRVTRALGECIGVLEARIGRKLDRSSPYYIRLVTHLKFFLSRILSGRELPTYEETSSVVNTIKTSDSRAWKCAESIVDLLKNSYGVAASDEEIAYLALHISLLVRSGREG